MGWVLLTGGLVLSFLSEISKICFGLVSISLLSLWLNVFSFTSMCLFWLLVSRLQFSIHGTHVTCPWGKQLYGVRSTHDFRGKSKHNGRHADDLAVFGVAPDRAHVRSFMFCSLDVVILAME